VVKHTQLKKNNTTRGHQASSLAKINGYSLTSEQLNRLLSADQTDTSADLFDKAVLKQQQLLTINNTLNKQNKIHSEIELLINANNGVYCIDSHISEFKLLCPPEILLNLSQPCKSTAPVIKNGDIINQNFFSLVNELLYSPLITLSKTAINAISEQERTEWYDWCNQLDSQIQSIKHKLVSAQRFFSLKTFDKLTALAKDEHTQEQLGNTKHLFQHNDVFTHDVEHDD